MNVHTALNTPQKGPEGPVSPPAELEVRYCLYARKSSETEERQALSVDSQIKEMIDIADKDNLKIVDMYRESHSAKDCGQRPVFNQLLNDVREGKFNGILVWHPDRLSRNAGDLGAIVDLLDQKKLVEIRTYSQKFTNNPNEKFLLMILGSQAKLENDNKSVNVKRGLRAKLEAGLWPSCPPTGYLVNENRNLKGHMVLDQERAPIIRQMFEKVAYEGYSGRKLYAWLKSVGFKSRSGIPLSLSNVLTILHNTFYYGNMEYPKGSGNWYKGIHEPIISEELFQFVAGSIARNMYLRRSSTEFAFTRLMKCGKCDSGVSAQEKYKKLVDGTTARYVYYGCNRNKDKDCKNQYVREEDLIKQFIEIIDKVNLDEIGLKFKIEREVFRYQSFQESVLGASKDQITEMTDIDIRNYAKYILERGSLSEQRELMSSLTSTILMDDKRITLL